MKKTAITVMFCAALLTSCGQAAQTVADTPDTAVSTAVSSETAVAASAAETESTTVTSEETETETETEAETEAASADAQVASGDETIAAVDVVDEGMEKIPLSDCAAGEYEVNVRSSSSMFKIAKAVLNVSDTPTLDIYISSSSYEYMYNGTAEEAAQADEGSFIYPVSADDMNKYTFPAEYLDGEIKIAAFSKKKQKWYDRSILIESASLPDGAISGLYSTAEDLALSDGEYTIEVTLEGGSGRASVQTPANMTVSGGKATAVIIWSSDKYDFMTVNGEKYLPIEDYDTSAFEIPITGFDYRMPVTADTTAMSTPHEIDYTLYFDGATAQPVG